MSTSVIGRATVNFSADAIDPPPPSGRKKLRGRANRLRSGVTGRERVLGRVGAVLGGAEGGEGLARVDDAPALQRRIGLGTGAAPGLEQLVAAGRRGHADDDLPRVGDVVEQLEQLAA